MSSAIDTTEEQVRTALPAAPSPGAAPQPTRRVHYILATVVLSAAAVAITLAWPHLFSAPEPPIVKASGRIEGREVTVAPKGIQGRITRLLADEGDTVVKGQLLAELDAAQIDAQYAAASGNVANLGANERQLLAHPARQVGRAPMAMSPWLRGVSLLSPLRYFIDFSFGVILKGNGVSVLVWDVVGIAILGVVLFTFSLLWFERSLKTTS